MSVFRTTLCAIALLSPVMASGDCTEDAMLVFDASGSMAEMGYNGLDIPRIFEAREALERVLPDVTPIRRVGLVVYGPGTADACSNVDLRLPPTPNAAGPILSEVRTIEPNGNTALTQAVEEAAEALMYRDQPGTVVLVTDGKETCGGATCMVAANLAAACKSLTVHVIGFRVRGDFFGWEGADANPDPEVEISAARCLADKNGGLYVPAETTQELVDALNKTLGCPVYGRLEDTKDLRPS